MVKNIDVCLQIFKDFDDDNFDLRLVNIFLLNYIKLFNNFLKSLGSTLQISTFSNHESYVDINFF